ncbi:YcxB family protein [Puia dinghuensis]|uniref:YcxB family protein n=1 Tax=Puia dinghuensis TaxID=1792502 RepID=A0A8J2XV87_9BACT|nr:YcxB family protein [Puia dinghuensis]GGB15227.1 hypothetical protein GCM10011511_43710 [Puia dinghuensis]
MQDTFIIPQDFTLGEWYSFAYASLYKSRWMRMVLLFITGINLIPLALEIPSIVLEGKFHPADILTAFIGPLFFLAFMCVGLLVGGPLIFTTKPELVHDITNRFTHWGLEIDTKTKQTSIPWRNLDKLKETKNFYWLDGKKGKPPVLIVIQKRMFASEEHRAAFKAFVTQNLTPP